MILKYVFFSKLTKFNNSSRFIRNAEHQALARRDSSLFDRRRKPPRRMQRKDPRRDGRDHEKFLRQVHTQDD